jgi:predicted extracellular nuclease
MAYQHLLFSLQYLILNLLFITLTSAVTISEINGPAFRSPFENQTLTDITGLVTAISPDGFFLRDTTPDDDPRTSSGLFFFTNDASITSQLSAGDIITIDGFVSPFRPSGDPTYLFALEVEHPENLQILSRNNEFAPVVIGAEGLHPPNKQYSALDNGDVFGLPFDVSLVEEVNAMLQPDKYGLDFWRSIEGEFVEITNPVVLDLNNDFGEVWVRGDWPTIGVNARGGLTQLDKNGHPDPIDIGEPLDGTHNPAAKQGDKITSVTGVIEYQFGFFYVRPLTAFTILSSASPEVPPPTTFASTGTCRGITIGQYNVDNLSPTGTSHINAIASHIANFLGSPDLMIIQEIEDNDGSGPTDGVVDASVTLQTLADAIESSSGVAYSFTEISPVDGTNGGIGGGNIRNAYLFNPDVLSLKDPNPGSATEAVTVTPGPGLSLNPGLVDPTNAAFHNSRKPLVAQFVTPSGSSFFAITVHQESKGGSSSLQGDPRPPINLGVDERTNQADVTNAFITELLEEDREAKIVLAGDFNEYRFVGPLEIFITSGNLLDMDDVVDRPFVERYSYVFENEAEQLDHMFVSHAVARARLAKYEHIHVNSWATTQVSDHDPSIAIFDLC